MQSRHYERAFERYLLTRGVPFVTLDQARLLLQPTSPAHARAHVPPELARAEDVDGKTTLKYFDYVVYGPREHLLVELKGRRIAGVPLARTEGVDPPERRQGPRRGVRRLECWTTLEDLGSLQRWERLFGAPFRAVMVFVYWCEVDPPLGTFAETFECDDRWYGLRRVSVAEYVGAMRVRSPRWRTVDLAGADFDAISGPCVRWEARGLPADRRVTPTIEALGRGPEELPDVGAILAAAGLG